MSSMGAKPDPSASDGKRIDVNCAFASLRVNSGVPHSPQKVRVVVLPLLARTEWLLGAPDTWSSAVATTTPEANGAPLDNWQSRQWQFNMAIGGLAHRYRTDPQAHFPERGGFILRIIWSTLDRFVPGAAAFRRQRSPAADHARDPS